MNFGFVENVKTTGNSSLEPNKIHEVTFDGCALRTIESAKGKFEVLDIKFSNDTGSFTDAVFDPGEDIDQDGMYGKTPSNVKALAIKIKHLLDAVYPENAPKVSQLSGSWNDIRKQIVELTNPGIGTKTKIKLMGREAKNPDGTTSIFPQFPGFFAGYTKAGALYLKTPFIGNNVYFKSSELDRIKKMVEAKPTEMTETPNKTKSIDYDF